MLLASAMLCAAAVTFYAADVKLPPPYATPSANNGPHVVSQPGGAKLQLPAGFSIDTYADGFERPRYMVLGPGGELLLSDSAEGGNGTVYVMPLNKSDGYKAHDRKKLITGLDRPYGLAFWHEYLYVGEPESIKRYKYDAKA